MLLVKWRPEAISALTEFKQGRLSGTREMVVHPNYLVVYRVIEQVEILTVLHTRQEFPSTLTAPFHSTSCQ
ncbi:type II toxin-antitoxin system RelE/ParE family toxin [Pseudomonas cedrina]|uniref:type II toxin-antitoxin system RelE/ParE family toxin n=1 Tax=Pseudomonas cedrina TaxID=651740 RepID=UPI000B800A55|nr:type II toxin-antitoxin system RelE/ParE family toxin [Pseudomonas cedrina]